MNACVGPIVPEVVEPSEIDERHLRLVQYPGSPLRRPGRRWLLRKLSNGLRIPRDNIKIFARSAKEGPSVIMSTELGSKTDTLDALDLAARVLRDLTRMLRRQRSRASARMFKGEDAPYRSRHPNRRQHDRGQPVPHMG